MCFPCQGYAWFLAHRSFWDLSFCVQSPLQEKNGSFREWSRDREGRGLVLTPNWLQFFLPEIRFFQIPIGLGSPRGGARRGILAHCTRSVLIPFAVIIRFVLLVVFVVDVVVVVSSPPSPWQCYGISIEFANHIICWGPELLETVRQIKRWNPILCCLGNSLALAIPAST